MNTASTGRVDLCTPQDLLDRVYHALGGHPDLDPASNPDSLVHSKVAVTEDRWGGDQPWNAGGVIVGDGLQLDWPDYGDSFFVNPPYARGVNGPWAIKVANEVHWGMCGVALIPVATSEKWWQPYWEADHLAFLVGRVKHIGEKHGAPFAQCVAGWGLEKHLFDEAFGEIARIR
jgi:hypothetical protein